MTHTLKRRGFHFGSISQLSARRQNNPNSLDNWRQGKPILLKDACTQILKAHKTSIKQSFQLYKAVLSNQNADEILAEPPYQQRLDNSFEALGCSINEGDDQEIETVLFDAIDPKTQDIVDDVLIVTENLIVAEDLWMKISWLSFHEKDASLRFRFSFGVDLHEDVALDKKRQYYAALLTDAIFPESNIITNHRKLQQQLTQILKCKQINFVERIIYFNAPNGGAYLHHDRERGHAGVVYAQLSGATFWLALSKQALIDEILLFIKNAKKSQSWPDSITPDMQIELGKLSKNYDALSAELDSFSNSTLIHLINETESFVQQLINHGHSRTVKTGDMLLLPQQTELNCCWHSVFTLGEETGESLSFAIRGE